MAAVETLSHLLARPRPKERPGAWLRLTAAGSDSPVRPFFPALVGATAELRAAGNDTPFVDWLDALDEWEAAYVRSQADPQQHVRRGAQLARLRLLLGCGRAVVRGVGAQDADLLVLARAVPGMEEAALRVWLALVAEEGGFAVTVPVAFTDREEKQGFVGDLTLQLFPGGGGRLFAHPEVELALPVEPSFRLAMADAWQAAQRRAPSAGQEGCWLLRTTDPRLEHLLQQSCHGPSAGLAAARGWLCARRSQAPDPGVLATGSCSAEGRSGAVTAEGVQAKAAEARRLGRIHTFAVWGKGNLAAAETGIGFDTGRIRAVPVADLDELAQLTEWRTDYGRGVGAYASRRAAEPPDMARTFGTTSVFVGREAQLARLEEVLLADAPRPTALCAVHGMPGIGKSYLAHHFARRHRDAFPGGVVLLAPQSGAFPAPDALIAEVADRLDLPGGAHVWGAVRARLQAPRTLLLVENVDDAEAEHHAGELVRRLEGCALLLTGRRRAPCVDAGCVPVAVDVLPLDQAVELLERELGAPGAPRAELEELAHDLGRLPLALHLAAGAIRESGGLIGPRLYLEELRRHGLDRGPRGADLAVDPEAARANLYRSFALSEQVLRAALGDPSLWEAFRMLGHAPAADCGLSLGAALCGLAQDRFRLLAVEAAALSLLAVEGESRAPRLRLHPLLAEYLRRPEDAAPVVERMTGWFVPRLGTRPETDEGAAWKEVHAEWDALRAWLPCVPEPEIPAVVRAGTWYAVCSGPFGAWQAFCERGLSGSPAPEVRSDLLWTLGQAARSAGDPARALTAASEKQEIDRRRGAPREAALAAGLRADILEARGDLDGALRIRREEELPVYERLGDMRSRALTQGRIADILQTRGDLDGALRIRREDCLPVYERLGDVRERAITQGQIADILMARGDLDGALRIRRDEELPVYERLGDVRNRAITQGKIADILMARGDLDGAIRIYQTEVLPVLERLGNARWLVTDRHSLSRYLLQRNRPGDREEAERLLELALAAAEEMRIPEAGQIRAIRERAGFAEGASAPQQAEQRRRWRLPWSRW